MGYPTSEAIKKGLYKTGSIITAAGLIMSVAFGSLLFSSSSSVNQLAFYLVWTVVFDTFIVRPLVAPIIMSYFGEANWFPGTTAKRFGELVRSTDI